MDPMFVIPKGRKPLRTGRLVLLLGLTVLLFLMIFYRYGAAAEAIIAAAVPLIH